jgi:DNA-binding transcriptional ArsR family regulator
MRQPPIVRLNRFTSPRAITIRRSARKTGGQVSCAEAQQGKGAMTKRGPGILPETIMEELRAGGEDAPELERMMRKARDASDFLKALAHETRLLLLCYLAEGERSVTELEEILSLRQPTVSQQLARLRLDGLVATRRDGKTIYYRIADERLHRVIAVIYDIFCREDGIGRIRS